MGGASRPEQLREHIAALAQREFRAQEPTEIDLHAREGVIDPWA